jgi:hypothetical protein
MSIYNFLEEDEEISLSDYVYDLISNNQNTWNPKYSIYIPSKGRAFLNDTSILLEGENITFKIEVEPQDYEAYLSHYTPEQLLVLDDNNQGVAYVRNWIKKYSTSIGELKHWQLDDDIIKFLTRPKGTSKNIKDSAKKCLSIVEHISDMYSNVAISGLTSDAYAFSKKYPVKHNRLAYICMLIDNKFGLQWDISGAEDWDFTFQVLENGYCTLTFYHIMFDTAQTMSKKGGCFDIYATGGGRRQIYETLIKKWPNRFVLKEYPNSKKTMEVATHKKIFR